MTGRRGRVVLGLSLAGAALFAAGGTILTRACRHALGPLDLFAVSGVILLIIVAPFHVVADYERIAAMTPLDWWAAVYRGVFGAGLGPGDKNLTVHQFVLVIQRYRAHGLNPPRHGVR